MTLFTHEENFIARELIVYLNKHNLNKHFCLKIKVKKHRIFSIFYGIVLINYKLLV